MRTPAGLFVLTVCGLSACTTQRGTFLRPVPKQATGGTFYLERYRLVDMHLPGDRTLTEDRTVLAVDLETGRARRAEGLSPEALEGALFVGADETIVRAGRRGSSLDVRRGDEVRTVDFPNPRVSDWPVAGFEEDGEDRVVSTWRLSVTAEIWERHPTALRLTDARYASELRALDDRRVVVVTGPADARTWLFDFETGTVEHVADEYVRPVLGGGMFVKALGNSWDDLRWDVSAEVWPLPSQRAYAIALVTDRCPSGSAIALLLVRDGAAYAAVGPFD
jgi:hypothetical protein